MITNVLNIIHLLNYIAKLVKYPNRNEITLMANRINIFLNEKDKLLKKLENLNDKNIIYKTIIHGIENEKNNYIKNVNIKHIIYGKEINFPKIYKDTPVVPVQNIKKINFNEILNKESLDLIKQKYNLSLLYKKAGDEFIFSLFNNSLNDIIKENNIQILEDISFLNTSVIQNSEIINLKGNRIQTFDFL